MTGEAPQPSEPQGEEVIEVTDATQAPPRSAAAHSEPLLDRKTKFWVWMLGAAVGAAVAAVVIGLAIG